VWPKSLIASASRDAQPAAARSKCYQVDYDRKNKRLVSLCFAGGDDLQALMVSADWAWAYTQFSGQYVDAERRAAARGVGVHAHHCQPPWEWRARSMGSQ
jgi:endonuclease YncB( thermonuclease family)